MVLHPKIPTCSGPDSHNEQTPALKVPLQTELRFRPRRYEQPPHWGACGAIEGRRMARRRPLQQQRRRRLLLRGPNSGSTDLRADAAAKRPPPMPKLMRQGRAEGRRVGGRSVAGSGYLVGGETSSGCLGERRHRKQRRSRSGLRARHAAAASATNGERPSPRSLREGADRCL